MQQPGLDVQPEASTYRKRVTNYHLETKLSYDLVDSVHNDALPWKIFPMKIHRSPDTPRNSPVILCFNGHFIFITYTWISGDHLWVHIIEKCWLCTTYNYKCHLVIVISSLRVISLSNCWAPAQEVAHMIKIQLHSIKVRENYGWMELSFFIDFTTQFILRVLKLLWNHMKRPSNGRDKRQIQTYHLIQIHIVNDSRLTNNFFC